mmetsp:Transcript_12056/g.44739  ORF Transcript_12056/g.44739 Transcript_12056/m.44739 type:complete len:330 (+) Transcript_12056:364-1353(+)
MERRGHHVLQATPQTRLSQRRGLEKLQVLRAMLEGVADAVLQVVFRQVNVTSEVREGHLRLNHPKFRKVARRVRIFSPERRPEGVDVAQRAAVGLHVELAADGQRRPPAEEVLGVVNVARSVARNVLHRPVLRQKRRHSELLSRALAVRRGDERRVHVQEPVIVEELVSRVRHGMSNASQRGVDARPRTQVCLLPEELEAVTLLRHRVDIRAEHGAQDRDGKGLELHPLPFLRTGDHLPADGQRCSGPPACLEGVEARRLPFRAHHLDARGARPIVELDEAQLVLRSHPKRPSPALDRGLHPDGRVAHRKKLFHSCPISLESPRRYCHC